jgi:hypothetical protein
MTDPSVGPRSQGDQPSVALTSVPVANPCARRFRAHVREKDRRSRIAPLAINQFPLTACSAARHYPAFRPREELLLPGWFQLREVFQFIADVIKAFE